MNRHMKSCPVSAVGSNTPCPASGTVPIEAGDIVVADGSSELRRIRLERGLLDACHGEQRNRSMPHRRA